MYGLPTKSDSAIQGAMLSMCIAKQVQAVCINAHI